jgi:hypothetical protein
MTHALDAPIANVLILAGLFFLAIGVLGKIGAKIEPGTAGRVLSGLLGAVLVVGGLIWHSATDQNLQAAAAHSPPLAGPQKDSAREETREESGRGGSALREPMSGWWHNDNPETKGITRLEIRRSAGLLVVHAWAKCHPEDCYWGSETGAKDGGAIRATWNLGNTRRDLTITPDGKRLRVIVDNSIRIIGNRVNCESILFGKDVHPPVVIGQHQPYALEAGVFAASVTDA